MKKFVVLFCLLLGSIFQIFAVSADKTGFLVIIYSYPSDGYSTPGHVFVRWVGPNVDITRGFASSGLRDDSANIRRATKSISYWVTQQEFNSSLNYQPPGDYGLFDNNCVKYGADIASRIGALTRQVDVSNTWPSNFLSYLIRGTYN
jgi:hypothetical protein